jgi:hypothetical protein
MALSEEVKYAHTHDLMRLIDELADCGEDVADLLDLVEFNPFAVQYRYELVPDTELEPIDRGQVLLRVTTLVGRVQHIIESK